MQKSLINTKISNLMGYSELKLDSDFFEVGVGGCPWIPQNGTKTKIERTNPRKIQFYNNVEIIAYEQISRTVFRKGYSPKTRIETIVEGFYKGEHIEGGIRTLYIKCIPDNPLLRHVLSLIIKAEHYRGDIFFKPISKIQSRHPPH